MKNLILVLLLLNAPMLVQAEESKEVPMNLTDQLKAIAKEQKGDRETQQNLELNKAMDEYFNTLTDPNKPGLRLRNIEPAPDIDWNKGIPSLPEDIRDRVGTR